MRAVADDDGPGANRPAFDEAAADIRIAFHEFLDHRGAAGLENEKRAIDGVGQGAAEDQFTAIVGLAGQAEVLFAVGGALFEVTVGEFLIEESEVGHVDSPEKAWHRKAKSKIAEKKINAEVAEDPLRARRQAAKTRRNLRALAPDNVMTASAASDGRDEEDAIAFLEGAGFAAEQTDVLFVEINVEELANLALVVADVAGQTGKL